MPTLPGAEPRLQDRYRQLIMSHLSPLHALAAGLRAMPQTAQPFAATQAAWRFYANARVSLPQLAAPLIARAQAGVTDACDHYALVVLDWSNLHFADHESKRDRVALPRPAGLGYQLLSALVVSDRDGGPIAPACLELRARDGIHTTRSKAVLKPRSTLDNLDPLMQEVDDLKLCRPPLYIIDREADSVGHYRRWAKARRHFLVRANDPRQVLCQGRERPLIDVAKDLKKQGQMAPVREVLFHGQKAWQFVGETSVTLHRPARTNRISGRGQNKKKRHKNIHGAPLTLRLIVSEVRGDKGQLLTRWLLLSNAPPDVSAGTLALWYYWRWRIESYHKLLKGAGLQVEHWLQDDAAALSRRLAVGAMAAVIVWHLARDPSRPAAQMREVLVRLSGRQIKRGPNRPKFTESALLAGMGVLLPMLCLLEEYGVEALRQLAQKTLPLAALLSARKKRTDSG